MKNAKKCLSFALTMFVVIPIFVNAQTYSVKGTVTASGIPVRYASVTFFDANNFAIQYSALTDSTGDYSLGPITAVKHENQQPEKFQLNQNYPNPFSSSTAISYTLNKQSVAKVTIYDVLGREMRTFNVGFQSAGSYGIVWNGRTDFGKVVAPGVYFYRLQANGVAQTRKMVFGTSININSVLLSGIISSQTKVGIDAIQSVPTEILSGGETFVVSITNTASTSPTIVPKQIGSVIIQSDTTINFSVDLPQAIVYLDSTQQIIRGFGGANALIFRPDMTPAEVQTAFGNGPGEIGMTIMRLSIPPDSTQFVANVSSAKLAESLGAKVFATPWTPPAWMKTNNSLVGGSLDTNNYVAFAAYLKSFADTMANNGAPLYAVSVQNEPDFNASYQSCLWNGTSIPQFYEI